MHRSSRKNSSFSEIELMPDSTVKFKNPLQIDLAGIAKGYVVDRASEILESFGIKNYIVNAGGDLRVGEVAHKIQIRNPQKLDSTIYETEISNSSLATSSGYFSYQEVELNNVSSKIYPIFKSQGEALKYEDESISVLAKDCIIADSLTKVVAILKEKSFNILSQFNAHALLAKNHNQIKFINK